MNKNMIRLHRIIDASTGNRFLRPLKILVTILALYLVNKNLTKGQMPELVNQLTWPHVALAVFLGFAGFYFQVLRWRIIVGWKGIVINEAAAFRTMLFGSLFAFVTPGRAGEFFRGVGLPVRKKTDTMYAVLIDKIFAGVTGFFFGITAMAVSMRTATMSSAHFILAVCFGVAFIAAGILLVARKHLWKVWDGRFSLQCTRRSLTYAVLLSIAAHVALCIQTAVLLDMFGSHAFLKNILAGAQAYAFMLFFPFFIANMGIREYSFGIFLGSYGLARFHNRAVGAIAFGASMGILCINMILPATAGLVWWIGEKRRMKGEG